MAELRSPALTRFDLSEFALSDAEETLHALLRAFRARVLA